MPNAIPPNPGCCFFYGLRPPSRVWCWPSDLTDQLLNPASASVIREPLPTYHSNEFTLTHMSELDNFYVYLTFYNTSRCGLRNEHRKFQAPTPAHSAVHLQKQTSHINPASMTGACNSHQITSSQIGKLSCTSICLMWSVEKIQMYSPHKAETGCPDFTLPAHFLHNLCY